MILPGSGSKVSEDLPAAVTTGEPKIRKNNVREIGALNKVCLDNRYKGGKSGRMTFKSGLGVSGRLAI